VTSVTASAPLKVELCVGYIIILNLLVMKTLIKKQGLILMAFVLTFSALACGKNVETDSVNIENGDLDQAALQLNIDTFPKEPLSDAERNSLILMREEEKLARDVYTTLYAKWGSRPFFNISSSEQTHMDAVLTLLKKYDIADPVGTNGIGVFQSATMQTLYKQLVALGNKSNLDAFKAGATIEDLDIFDLKRLSSEVDNKDVLFVYDNLERGSRNHMRAFNRNIGNMGSVYIPQYISQADFDAILSGSMETGH
jgi:hypothetical protein